LAKQKKKRGGSGRFQSTSARRRQRRKKGGPRLTRMCSHPLSQQTEVGEKKIRLKKRNCRGRKSPYLPDRSPHPWEVRALKTRSIVPAPRPKGKKRKKKILKKRRREKVSLADHWLEARTFGERKRVGALEFLRIKPGKGSGGQGQKGLKRKSAPDHRSVRCGRPSC